MTTTRGSTLELPVKILEASNTSHPAELVEGGVRLACFIFEIVADLRLDGQLEVYHPGFA